MWHDLESLRLDGQKWCLDEYQLHTTEQKFINNAAMELVSNGSTSRGFNETIRVGVTADFGIIDVSLRTPEGIGCRLLCKGLYHLSVKCGGVNQLPSRIFFRSSMGYLLPRGLLALKVLPNPESRFIIKTNYEHKHVAKLHGEKAKFGKKSPRMTGELSYEERIPALIGTTLPSYQPIALNALCLKYVKSSPDGLLLHSTSGELMIIEAKMHDRDFVDGTAQVLQYYGQALFHPAYHNLHIKTMLVTADSATKDAYEFWEALMISKRTFDFFVDLDKRNAYRGA